MVLEVNFPNQQHQHPLGAAWKCKFLAWVRISGGRWSLAVWFTSLRVMLILSWKTSLQMLSSNPHLACVSSSAHLEGGLGCHVSLIRFLFKKAQSNFLLTVVRQPCVVQSLNHVWLFVIPGTAAHQASLSLTASQSLLKLMSSESTMLSNHRILCHPLLLPSVFPNIRVFSSSLHQVAKVLEFQLQHQSFQWIPRTDLL